MQHVALAYEVMKRIPRSAIRINRVLAVSMNRILSECYETDHSVNDYFTLQAFMASAVRVCDFGDVQCFLLTARRL